MPKLVTPEANEEQLDELEEHISELRHSLLDKAHREPHFIDKGNNSVDVDDSIAPPG